MKKIHHIIIKSILFLILTYSCKAQTVSLDTRISNTENNAYVKDLDNELDKFTGTWVYNNGNVNWTLEIKKLTHKYNGRYYEDYLIGEYSYTVNGLTIINTLSELPDVTDNVNNPNQDGVNNNGGISVNTNYNIGGRYIITGPDHNCNDCLVDERRIELYFSDPEREYLSIDLVLRYLVNESNPEKITAIIISSGSVVIPEDGFESPRVPYGTYLMEKQ